MEKWWMVKYDKTIVSLTDYSDSCVTCTEYRIYSVCLISIWGKKHPSGQKFHFNGLGICTLGIM